MGSAEIVSGTVSNHFVGTTDVDNPVLFMEVDGVPVASAYVVQEVASSKRFIFPKKVGNEIYIMAMGQTYGADLASLNLSVRVFVAE